MPKPQELPATLLAELGYIITSWASIEQNLILQSSAMAAVHTDGKPEEYLRMDFKRLRKKWFSLCRDAFPRDVIDTTVNPLNSNLAKLSLERGYYVHGTWKRVGRGRYRLSCWEQKDSLRLLEGELELDQIRRFSAACRRTSFDVSNFASNKHSDENRFRAVGEITIPLVPINKG